MGHVKLILVILLSFVYFNEGTYRLIINCNMDEMNHNKYVVIFDAGSTGTRAVGFLFRKGKSRLKLVKSFTEELKPGLSSYHKNPGRCLETMIPLMEKAKSFVPFDERKRTLLVLKATAGVRLLTESEITGLRETVLNLFKLSHFATTDRSFRIIDGATEAFYAWYAVNFLLGYLYDGYQKYAAVLELGGGSTQIAFVPTNPESIKCNSDNCFRETLINGKKITVYIQSYKHLGLNSSRKGVLNIDNVREETKINNECINPKIKNHDWTYTGVTYSLSGPANGVISIEKCNAIVRKYIKSQNVYLPTELSDIKLTAFSNFYGLATEAGIFEKSVKMAETTVGAYQTAASEACKHLNEHYPFLCMDLTIIYFLLVDGYGLRPDKKITLLKKINEHEVSWTLGASIDVLQNGLGN
ncbi:ectonucleoside triphosphate diphosphohydrolase 5-like [Lycorma delicatula]|uniref:ectonucleoside triphosphate diphosphohydrolase 5-like n=1 Tax=Lycorma delicatula TaxID=130591 RepID=UPI003F515881